MLSRGFGYVQHRYRLGLPLVSELHAFPISFPLSVRRLLRAYLGERAWQALMLMIKNIMDTLDLMCLCPFFHPCDEQGRG